MKVSKVTILSSGIPMEYIREMKFYMELGTCNHPNIVKVALWFCVDVQMYDCYVDNNRVHLIMERCRGDLLDLVSNKDVTLSIADVKAILYDVLSPLKMLHTRYIAHRVCSFGENDG